MGWKHVQLEKEKKTIDEGRNILKVFKYIYKFNGVMYHISLNISDKLNKLIWRLHATLSNLIARVQVFNSKVTSGH